jgi:hypothetical protein
MNKMTRSLTLIATIFSLTLLNSSQAKADVIYDAFGPGDTYRFDSGSNVFGLTSGIFYEDSAVRFNTGLFSGTLTTIEVPITSIYLPGPANVTFSLTTDGGGVPGGIILESWSIPVTYSLPGSVIYTMTSVGGLSLSSGTNYWLMAGAASPDAATWNSRNTGVAAAQAYRSAPGDPWINNGSNPMAAALRVSGTTVTAAAPEPGTLTLLALGVVGGLVRRRKLHREA